MGSYWVKIDFEKVKIVVKITRNVTYTSLFLITELPFQVLTTFDLIRNIKSEFSVGSSIWIAR